MNLKKQEVRTLLGLILGQRLIIQTFSSLATGQGERFSCSDPKEKTEASGPLGEDHRGYAHVGLSVLLTGGEGMLEGRKQAFKQARTPRGTSESSFLPTTHSAADNPVYPQFHQFHSSSALT